MDKKVMIWEKIASLGSELDDNVDEVLSMLLEIRHEYPDNKIELERDTWMDYCHINLNLYRL